MEKEMFELFGKNVKFLRTQKGISQKKLGVLMGKTEDSAQPYVSKLEKGKKPSTDDLVFLATFFDVSIDFLLGCDKAIKEKKESKTMQDILAALFSLEDTDIEFTRKTEKDMDYNPYTNSYHDIELITNCISFKCAYLNDFLHDWEKTLSISKYDGEAYKNMYNAWKKEALEKAKDYDVKGNRIYSVENIPF